MAAADSDDLTYPRPQLRRERWVDLCGEWGFAFDDGDRGIAERWFDAAEPFDRTIQVPFPPESRLSGGYGSRIVRSNGSAVSNHRSAIP